MADFAVALKAWLKAQADIGPEIHWAIVPQGKSLPYTRLQVISDGRPATLDGYDDARETRVQVDCFASKWGLAREMAEKVIAATAEPHTQDGVRFGRVVADGPRDFGEDTAAGYVFRASTDLLVWHQEV